MSVQDQGRTDELRDLNSKNVQAPVGHVKSLFGALGRSEHTRTIYIIVRTHRFFAEE